MKKILLNTLLFLSTTWAIAQTYGNVTVVSGISSNSEVGITQNYPFQFNPQPPSNQGYNYYVIDWWSVTTSSLGQTIPGHVNNIPDTNMASIFGNWEQISVSTPKYISIPIAFGELSPKESYIKVSCYGTFYKAGGTSPLPFFTEIVTHNLNLYKVKQPTLSLTNQFLDCCTQNVNICASDYSDANSFAWTVSGGTIASGQGSSCISVTPNASGSITANCTVKRTTGLSNYTASNSKTFTRSARSSDFVALYPEHPNNTQPYEYICKGIGRQMQMQDQCGLTSINWVANNCSISGQNTLTPTITPNNSVATGSFISIYAVVSFNGGCTATTPTKTYKVLDGNLVAPQGNITLIPNNGDFCTAEIYDLNFVSSNGFASGITTISPDFIFGTGDEHHYRPGKRTRVTVCNKNLCTGQISCTQMYVTSPQPCYTEKMSSPKIEISPNPALDNVSISLPDILSGEIQIFDQNNFAVQSLKFNNADEILLKLNAKLVSGIYVVKVITENYIFTEKLIIK